MPLVLKGGALVAAAAASWWAWSQASDLQDRAQRIQIALAIVGLMIAATWFARGAR